MAYEIFKETISKKDFLATKIRSDGKKIKNGNERYEKYMIKAEILCRDDFTCQNVNCPHCKNEVEYPKLTWHHIKFQKNGGKDSARNGITLCHKAHDRYHAARDSLTFADNIYLPSHIRGQTFKLDIPDERFWKQVKWKMKKLRKTLKMQKEITAITFDQIAILLAWLETKD